jgi:hypothetical protein
MSKPEPAGRLQRWALKIQEYDMKIGYRPGKSHQNADCLSRIPKNLGAIPKTPTGAGVIAAVTFTPHKETRQTTESIHVGVPKTEISEWARLHRTDEYCQMLIKRIEEENKEEARWRRRFNEHIQFEKDYEHILADEKRQRQRENPEKAAREEYRDFLAIHSRIEPKTKRYSFN